MTPSDSLVPCVLSFASASSLTRRGEPVVCGVPLPRGLVKGVDVLAAGVEGALQTEVLDRWSDGSARWALVSLRVDQDDAAPSAVTLAVAPAGSVPTRPSLVSHKDTRVLVDTGRLQLTLGSGGRWPVLAATIDGREVCDAAHSGLMLTAAGGAEISVSVDRVWVEREGPSHALIRASGQHMNAGRALAYVEWQITVYAGLPVMQVAVTLRNPRKAEHPGGHWELGDAGSLLLEDVTFALRVPAQDRVSAGACSVDVGEAVAGVTLPFALYQESSGGERWNGSNHLNRDGCVPQTMRGYRRSDGITGLRSTPLLQLQTSAGVITFATEALLAELPETAGRRRGRTALRVVAARVSGCTRAAGRRAEDARVRPRVRRGRHHRRPARLVAIAARSGHRSGLDGRDRRRRCTCSRKRATHTPPTSRSSRRRSKEPTRSWTSASGSTSTAGATSATSTAITRRCVTQGPDPLVSHYNNQYDPVAGFAIQFLRSGDPRWWPHDDDWPATSSTSTSTTPTEDKAAYNHGLFWHTYHYVDAGTATHRTYPKAPGSHGGGPAVEHNYTTGLMLTTS